VHAVISLLLQSRKFWWYLLLTSLMLLHDVIMISYCCQRYAECLCGPARATVNSCVKKRQTLLRPTCGLQTAQISVLWITRSGLWRSIVSSTDKSIVWMNWNGGSSMSGAVFNGRFLMRVLTSGEEDIARVSILKEDILSTAVNWQCWFCPHSVTFRVTCLTVTSLITKSCRQHSCSFYKVVH